MADDVYARVGAAIRNKRSEIGMTQALLASKTGLGRTSITNIEKGSQGILLHQLIDVARALRSDPKDFLTGIDRDEGFAERVTSPSDMVTDLLGRLDKPVQARRR